MKGGVQGGHVAALQRVYERAYPCRPGRCTVLGRAIVFAEALGVQSPGALVKDRVLVVDGQLWYPFSLERLAERGDWTFPRQLLAVAHGWAVTAHPTTDYVQDLPARTAHELRGLRAQRLLWPHLYGVPMPEGYAEAHLAAYGCPETPDPSTDAPHEASVALSFLRKAQLLA